MKRIAQVIIVSLSILVSHCTVTPPKQAAQTPDMVETLNQGMINNSRQPALHTQPLKNAVIDALIPSISVSVPKQATRHHYLDISANRATASEFFASLAEDSHYNIIISPGVQGNITLNLKHVTIQQIMEAIENIYGYQYEQTSYGFNIYPARLETQTFHVSYLNINRAGTSETSISSGQITSQTHSSSSGNSSNTSTANETVNASTVKTETISNFWGELTRTLNAIVGVDAGTTEESEAAATPPAPAAASTTTNNRRIRANPTPTPTPAPSTTNQPTPPSTHDNRAVIVNPQSGLIVVRAYPYQLHQVSKYLHKIQTIMNRQVIINAKILEVTLSAGYQSGIDWQLLGLSQAGIDLLDSTLQPFTNIFTAKITADHGFESLIKLMQSQGRVNVISSPRIATVNNQKAIIKVGKDRFYITNVETTTNTSAVNSQIIGENVELTPFFSGVALDVTPEIDKDGEITLHLHPIISLVEESELKFTLNNQSNTLPSAESAIRESDNIVRVRNNEMVIIGGLMLDTNKHDKGGIPIVSRIPGIGWFFQNHQNSSDKSEIIILLQPILVNKKSIREQLLEASRHYRAMDQEFSFQTKVYRPKQAQSRYMSPQRQEL